MWGRLQTRDRLRKIGLQVESECPMCGLHTETADHLFTQCSYVRNCSKELNRNLQLIPLFSDLGSMSDWLGYTKSGTGTDTATGMGTGYG
ncbi:ATP-dependent helicase/nuclease subunit A [Bienertia sinuspersici]